jgi:hypothetical protein
MSVAHVDLLVSELEAVPRRARPRIALVFGCTIAFALAAVPAAVSVLLIARPDLFLAR